MLDVLFEFWNLEPWNARGTPDTRYSSDLEARVVFEINELTFVQASIRGKSPGHEVIMFDGYQTQRSASMSRFSLEASFAVAKIVCDHHVPTTSV